MDALPRPPLQSDLKVKPVGSTVRLFPRTGLLRQVTEHLGKGTRVLYLWGPPASGKTVLLRQIHDLVTARDIWSIRLTFSETSTPQTVQVDLNSVLDPSLPATGSSDDWLAIAKALRDRATDGLAVLMIDDYDRSWSWEPWLREQFFSRLDPRVALLLTGRRPPDRFWAGDRLWREKVVAERLPDLNRDQVAEFLTRSGVASAHADEVYALSKGRIGFVARAADALAASDADSGRGRLWSSRRSASVASRSMSFLVEHVLHPGSRRTVWRAGAGRPSLDTVVAAASLIPVFQRGLLAEMIGREVVDRYWDALQELPIVHQFEGGYYGIADPLRRRMERLVLRGRPWASSVWRRRAAIALIANVSPDDDVNLEATWASLGHLARQRYWGHRRRPDVDLAAGWHFEWQSGRQRPDGVQALTLAGPVTAMPHSPHPTRDGHVVTALDDDGRVIGYITMVEGSFAPWRDVLWVTTLALDPAVAGLQGALVQEAAKEWVRHQAVMWVAGTFAPGVIETGDPPLDSVLNFLRFQGQDVGLRDAVGVLDFTRLPYHRWLREVITVSDPMPSEEDIAAMARDVLQAVGDPDALVRTALAERYQARNEDATPALVRSWVLDALASADLGDLPSGRALLTLYYLDKSGSHEALAERFNVSRATYFRSHRRALTLLGEALWQYV